MLSKQKILAFDVFAITLIAVLAIGVLSFGKTLALLNPSFASTNSINRIPTEQPATLPNPQEVKQIKTDKFIQELQSVIDRFVAGEPNQYGIYIKHLETGAIVRANANKNFVMASMYKPFVVVEALRMINDKKISPTTILNEEKSRTVKQCIEDTITVSDNPCGRELLALSNLSSQEGLTKLKNYGYQNTKLQGDYPLSTAQDIGKLFENIYKQSLLPSDLNINLLNTLKAQTINDRLPLGLSNDMIFAHKTGDLEGYVHDGGIIYSPRGDYIIIVLSGPDNSGRSLLDRYARFGALMKEVESTMVKIADL